MLMSPKVSRAAPRCYMGVSRAAALAADRRMVYVTLDMDMESDACAHA